MPAADRPTLARRIGRCSGHLIEQSHVLGLYFKPFFGDDAGLNGMRS